MFDRIYHATPAVIPTIANVEKAFHTFHNSVREDIVLNVFTHFLVSDIGSVSVMTNYCLVVSSNVEAACCSKYVSMVVDCTRICSGGVSFLPRAHLIQTHRTPIPLQTNLFHQYSSPVNVKCTQSVEPIHPVRRILANTSITFMSFSSFGRKTN